MKDWCFEGALVQQDQKSKKNLSYKITNEGMAQSINKLHCDITVEFAYSFWLALRAT
jgi:hypothetical protein